MFLDPQAVTEQLMILLPLLPEEESSKAPMPPPMSNLIYRVIYLPTNEGTHLKEQGDAPAGASDNGAPGNAAAPAAPTPSRRYSTQPRSSLPPIRLLAYPNDGLMPPGAVAPLSFSSCGSAKKAAEAASTRARSGGGLHARQERRRHAVARHLEEGVLLARPGHRVPLVQP